MVEVQMPTPLLNTQIIILMWDQSIFPGLLTGELIVINERLHAKRAYGMVYPPKMLWRDNIPKVRNIGFFHI